MEGGYQTMSTQIDERVVSMQFDNSRFEKNVSKSISTLDKLKKSLNLTGASKGLENVNTAAKKVDMRGLANNVETVKTKFSALEVVGVTALANIANSAVNAGKRLAKSLSIDQIMSGYSKYDQKTASVQTLLNSTGKSLDEINTYLEKLMWFSDETSYSFTDMTSALAQMTSSGGDIDKLIPLITGVANATAFAGKGAREFSSAMYNLNQSYSKGYLDYADWKSIDLMGVSSKQLKQTIIDTAIAMGKLDAGAVTVDNFASTLQDKWADREVLETAFSKFSEFSEAVNKLVNGDISGFSKEVQDLYNAGKIETAADAIEALSEHYGELGVKAFKSAQEAKTFTEAIDATKDAVSSGWMRTFEIIFGTYEQAKKTWTSLANWLWDVFASGSESRNAFLEKVMNYNPMTAFLKKLEGVSEAIGNVSKAVQDYSEIVNRVIRGDFGNGAVRIEKLTAAGWEYAEVQNRVNEKLGCSVRHITKASQAQQEQKDTVVELTDAKLEELGLTKKEIRLYRDLEKQSKKTGKSITQLISEMETMDTRTLLMSSFKNIGDSLLGVFQALKEAWAEIFPPPTVVQIYNIINGFHKLTESLRITDKETGELNETGDKIRRTFKGIFAIIDIALTILNGPAKIVFSILKSILKGFGVSILDVTAYIGDAIVKFRDWIKSLLNFDGIIEKITPYLKKATDAVRNWFEAVQPLKKVADIFRHIIDAVKDLSTALYNTDIVQNLVRGLTNGLKNGAKMVWEGIKNLAKGIINTIKKVLGIHSPSTVMFAIGGFIVSGLVLGIKDGAGNLFKSIKELGSKIIGAFKGIDLSSVSTLFYNIFRLFPQLKILNVLSALINIMAVCGENIVSGLAGGISKAAPAVWDAISSIAVNLVATFKKILGIHSPSRVMIAIGGFIIAGLMLGLKDGAGNVSEFFKDLGNNTISLMKTIAGKIVSFIKNLDFGTVFAIAATSGLVILAKKTIDALTMFAQAAKGFSKIGTGVGNVLDAIAERIKPKKASFKEISKGILNIAIAVGILAGSVYLLAQLDSDKLWWSVLAIGALAAIMGGLVAALSMLKTDSGIKIGAYTFIILTVAASVALLAKSLKTLGSMDEASLTRGYKALAGLGLIIAALIFTTKLAGKNAGQVGKTLLWISVTLLLLIFVTKQIAKLNERELTKGIAFLIIFALFIKYLMKATLGTGYNTKGLGASILGIATAILMLAFVARIIGGMDTAALVKGIGAMIVFAAIIAGLIRIVKIGKGTEIAKVGGVILAVGTSILLMTVATALLGKMDMNTLIKGQTAIGVFAIMIAGLINVVKKNGADAKNLGKALLSIAIAIGILALVAVVLGLVDIAQLMKGILVVGILSAIVAGLIRSTKGAQNCMKNLIVITVAMVLLTGMLAILSLIDPERLITSAASLGIVMAALALMIKSSSSLGDAKSMIKPLATMLIVVGALGLIMWGLSALPMGNDILSKALSIAAVMTAMSIALFAVSAAGNTNSSGALKGVLALTAMVVPMALFVAALAFMPALPDHVWSTLSVLLPVMIVMTALLIPLALIGTLGWSALIGVLALTAMVVPMIAFTAALAFMPKLPSHVGETLNVLLPVMIVMTALLVPLALIGVLGWSALMGVLALTAMVVPMIAFTAALAFMPKLPEHAVTTLETVLKVMAVLTLLLVPLSIVGVLGPFALVGVLTLCVFVEELTKMASGIIAFAEELKGVSVDDLNTAEHAIKLLKKLAEVSATLPVFSRDIKGWAENFPFVAKGIAGFVDAIAGSKISEENLELAKQAVEVVKVLAQASKEIPNTGGLIASLVGDNDLSTWAEQLPNVGKGIVGFVDILTEANIDSSAVEIAKKAAEIVTVLAEAAAEIPNAGGYLATWIGDNDLSKWAKELPKVAEGVAGFITGLTTNASGGACSFGEEQVNIAKKAAEIVKILAKAATEIPNAGGYLATWIGDNDLSTWAAQLPNVGKGVAGFAKELGTFDEGQLATIKAATKAVEAIASISDCTTGDFSNFGNGLSNLAKKLKEFIKTMSEVSAESVESAVDKIKKIVNLAKTISKTDSSVSKDFGKNMASLAKDAVKGFVNAFDSEDTISKVDKAAVKFVKEFIKAMEKSQDKVNSAVSDIAKEAAEKIVKYGKTDNKENFKSAGKDLIDGLINGLKNKKKKQEVYDAAFELGQTAVEGEKKGQKSNSPSKATEQAGNWLGEGLTQMLRRILPVSFSYFSDRLLIHR